MVKKGIIERVGKGIFKIGENKFYKPNLDSKTKSVFKKILENFPYLGVCIWNISTLNEFSQHISNNSLIIIEVEKEVSESVFLFLKEQSPNVFINPNSLTLEHYVFSAPNPIVIKNFLSESPVQKVSQYTTITIEKLLVDIYCDKDLFSYYQGRELQTIFRNAFEKYTVNTTKLLRYASRRGKKKQLNQIVIQIIGNKG